MPSLRQLCVSVFVCIFVFMKVVQSERNHVTGKSKSTNVVGKIDTSDLMRELKRSILHHVQKAEGCENQMDKWSPTSKRSKVSAEFNMKPLIKELKRTINHLIKESFLAIDFGMRPNQSQTILSILSSLLEEKIMSSIDLTLTNLTEIIFNLTVETGILKLQQAQLIKFSESIQTSTNVALQHLSEAITGLSASSSVTSTKLQELEEKRKQEDVVDRLNKYELFAFDCPHDWLKRDDGDRSSCYKFITKPPKNWHDARTECQKFGSKNKGKLVEIETEEEGNFVKEQAKKSDEYYFWIGATKIDKGYWHWATSGKNVTYTDWDPNRPTTTDTDVVVDLLKAFDYRWNNLEPIHVIPYICEISID